MEAIDHTPEPLTSTLHQRGHPHMLRGDTLALRLQLPAGAAHLWQGGWFLRGLFETAAHTAPAFSSNLKAQD
jgi:hypothetical protein